jgi:hypothetical protein
MQVKISEPRWSWDSRFSIVDLRFLIFLVGNKSKIGNRKSKIAPPSALARGQGVGLLDRHGYRTPILQGLASD